MKPPLLFRLMLGTLFLPIILLFCVLWYMISVYETHIWQDQSTTLGLWSPLYFIVAMTLPFLLYAWIVWSGGWRKPIITAAVIYGGGYLIASLGFAFDFIRTYTPPEKRMIHLTGVPGTDVYCNGIHLGQLPLRIRVDELIAKVPEWTTPPEQRWYDERDHSNILYTWVPWDDFIEERFEASRNLFGDANTRRNQDGSPLQMTPRLVSERREVLNRHNADARYWWSFRFVDTQKVQRQDTVAFHRLRIFDNQSSYHFGGTSGDNFPSLDFHVQLLVDVLPELTPEQKTDWDRHVLKYWALLARPLQHSLNQAAARYRHRDGNDPLVKLFETALHSTARLMWGISDPPTEEDARRLLTDWVERSIDPSPERQRVFHFGWGGGLSGDMNLRPAQIDHGALLPANIHEVMRQPLIEQWRRNKLRYDDGWAPVAYYSGLDRSADYFAYFARNFATMQNARIELLTNESPQVAALFNTLLHRRAMHELLAWRTYLYADRINIYSRVDNPLVESAFRTYIENALIDTNHDEHTRREVNHAVFNAIFQRIDRESIDRDDFAVWVASLPIAPTQRNHVLRQLRLRGQEDPTFADRLQRTAGRLILIETELTIDDMTEWFDANEGGLTQFLTAHRDNIVVTNIFDGRHGWNQHDFSIHVPSRIDRFSDTNLTTHDPMEMGAHFGTRTVGQGENQWEMWHELPACIAITLLRSDTPEGDPQIRDIIRRIWSHDRSTIANALLREYTRVNIDHADRRQTFLFTGANNLPDWILDLYLDDDLNEEGNPRHSGRGIAEILALSDSPKAGEILERVTVSQATETENQRFLRQHLERLLEIWQVRDGMRQMKMEFFLAMVAGDRSPDDLLLPQPAWVWRDGRYVQGE